MPIDLQKEEVYSLRDATRFVPRSASTRRRVHRSVLWRWATIGLKVRGQTRGQTRDETRVVLETVQAGGSLATSREAIHRFFAELTRRASLPSGSAAPTGKDDVAAGGRAKSSDIQKLLDEAGF